MIKKYKRENDEWLSRSWLDKMLSLSIKLRTNWYKGKGEKGRSKRCSEAVKNVDRFMQICRACDNIADGM